MCARGGPGTPHIGRGVLGGGAGFETEGPRGRRSIRKPNVGRKSGEGSSGQPPLGGGGGPGLDRSAT